jgi:hypothetical protein
MVSPSFQSAVHGDKPKLPSTGGRRRTASIVPISPCDHGIGLGGPVVPDVCRKQNGSLMDSSKVFAYGYGFTSSLSRRSLSKGSSRCCMERCSRTLLTRGTGEASPALTQASHLVASRTARAPCRLFLGERNRACGEVPSQRPTPCGIIAASVQVTHRVANLDAGICQQHMPQVIYAAP